VFIQTCNRLGDTPLSLSICILTTTLCHVIELCSMHSCAERVVCMVLSQAHYNNSMHSIQREPDDC